MVGLEFNLFQQSVVSFNFEGVKFRGFTYFRLFRGVLISLFFSVSFSYKNTFKITGLLVFNLFQYTEVSLNFEGINFRSFTTSDFLWC